MPPPPAPPPKPINLATDDVPCRNRSFNLHGLAENGNCPECGTAIWLSIQEDLLVYSSERYVASLHRGLICILIAALIQIAIAFISIVVGLAIFAAMLSGRGGAAMNNVVVTAANSNLFNAILQLISLPVALLSLYGWWLFSSRDPGQRAGDSGETPRRVVRAAVTTLAAFNVIYTAGQFVVIAVPAATLIVGGLGLIAAAAAIAQFFAAMLYIKWMGPRIPDPDVTDRASPTPM